MHELEELLSEHLDTRVRVEGGGRRGRVVVEFADLDDLERIYRAMTEPTSALERDNPRPSTVDNFEGDPSTGG
jgi:hypothetical protein